MRADTSRWEAARSISCAWVKSVIILVVFGVVVKRSWNAYLMTLFLLLLSMKQLAALILSKRLWVASRWSFSERFTIAYAGKWDFIASCPLVIWLRETTGKIGEISGHLDSLQKSITLQFIESITAVVTLASSLWLSTLFSRRAVACYNLLIKCADTELLTLVLYIICF